MIWSIEDNIKEVIKKLDDFDEKQLPYATKEAVNATLFDIRDRTLEVFKNQFKEPNMRYLKAALEVKKAKNKRDIVAEFGIREGSLGKGTPFHDVLDQHFFGGDRNHKRFEKALLHWGLLNTDELVVAGKYMRKNKFGNLTAAKYSELMSYLGLHYKAGYLANMTTKNKIKKAKYDRTKRGYKRIRGVVYFVADGTGHLDKGIYQKKGIHGIKLTPVTIFAKKKSGYKKRFDFKKLTTKTINKKFNDNFKRAFKFAMKTAIK